MSEKKSKFLTYKGKPLVRNGNTIYYGNMSDKYVIMMQIMSTKTVNDLELADKVIIQLMYTDPDIKTRDRVVKKSEKHGLYNAMDIGSIWLERALAE
ncbi:MAG TPA: hypothetical protein H9675_01525 [Firmicutes bacterium]|nr:hypothetical protein [Bacillota bacterium]